MDFSIPEEYKMLRDSVRRFVQEELMPLEKDYADQHDIPEAERERLQQKAKELGFWAMDIPEEYGGGGVGPLGMCFVYEELAKCNVPAFRAANVFSPFLGPILFKLNEEQKEKYLYPVIRGEKRTCFALTETNGGSDPSQMLTSARKDGDRYIINGTKIFITGADKADFIQLFAVTDKEKRGRGGVTCFLIDKDTPGVSLGQNFELMSSDRPWEVVFNDVVISKEQIAGEEGQGFALSQEFLNYGRLQHGPKAVGRAERALKLAVEYAKERVTFGQPIASRQAIQWMIADSAVEIHTTRLMVYHAAWKAEQGMDFQQEASMVKLYADEMLNRVIDRAIQILGGIGLSKEYPLEVMFRDARSRRITEGSSEMQRHIIARNIIRDLRYIDYVG